MVQVSVQNVKKMARHVRRPSHTFSLNQKPFQIQPFLLAPVLPGETLTNLLYQCRAVTKPITAPLIGWWYEAYFLMVSYCCFVMEKVPFYRKKSFWTLLISILTALSVYFAASCTRKVLYRSDRKSVV